MNKQLLRRMPVGVIGRLKTAVQGGLHRLGRSTSLMRVTHSVKAQRASHGSEPSWLNRAFIVPSTSSRNRCHSAGGLERGGTIKRKPDFNSTTACRDTLACRRDFQDPVVLIGDGSCYRQTEATAVGGMLPRPFPTEEPFEDLRHVGRIDTDPVIRDGDHHLTPVVAALARHPHLHSAAIRRILHGVVEQDQQETLQRHAIAADHEDLVRRIDPYTHVSSLGEHRGFLACRSRNIEKVERGVLPDFNPRVRAGQDQQIVDQRRHPARMLQHLGQGRPVLVDWNAERNYEDLRLMSACQALISVNSTFSWWAGWLNPRTDKIVVVPRQWYRRPGVTSDLPGSGWATPI